MYIYIYVCTCVIVCVRVYVCVNPYGICDFSAGHSGMLDYFGGI